MPSSKSRPCDMPLEYDEPELTYGLINSWLVIVGQALDRPEVAGVSVEAVHRGLRHDGDQRQPFACVGEIFRRVVGEIADRFSVA